MGCACRPLPRSRSAPASPSAVLFRQITSNIKNTVTGLKQILGKKYHSEEIQHEISKVAYSVTESLGNVTIPVRPPPPGGTPRSAGCFRHWLRQAAQPHAPCSPLTGGPQGRAERHDT